MCGYIDCSIAESRGAELVYKEELGGVRLH